MDVCEIGQRVWARGDVRQVKVLGTIALIDEGELHPLGALLPLPESCVYRRDRLEDSGN